MREMNESAADFFGWDAGEPMDAIDVDIKASEGDVINMDAVTLRVMEAPGHTKCCVSFCIPEKKRCLPVKRQAVLPAPGLSLPVILWVMKLSINYINRLLEMELDKILTPHHGVLTGEDCTGFINDALRSAIALKDMIISEHKRGKSLEEITGLYDKQFNSEHLRSLSRPKRFI
jgi:glyoxylase-like metal-dependent hydrolase (beta-lactamase superfamily II)